MEYRKTITLKDGRNCIIRNGLAQDGNAAREVFLRTHGETDYLLTYPDETRMTGEQEAQFLKERTESLDEVELVAEIAGCLVGTAGIRCLGRMDKIRHRAEFGIGILRDYWGLGIGRALTESCLECARAAGYAQLELDVVAENAPALALYQSLGFTEYGRNPRGFRSRRSGWQELVLMRLELDPGRDYSTILK